MPYEDHGDPRNVIEQAFLDAGKTKEIKNAGRPTAKQNMLELLQAEERSGDLEEPKQSYAEKEGSKRG
jgi:hypothetical protein